MNGMETKAIARRTMAQCTPAEKKSLVFDLTRAHDNAKIGIVFMRKNININELMKN